MIGNRYEYDTMASCEQQLWWYRCLHDLTLQKIKKNTIVTNPRILDAGCGTGGLLLYLKKNGYADLSGFDLSPDAVDYARESSGIDVQKADITKPGNIYHQNSFDIITSNDILCQLGDEQEKEALAQLLILLKPGGLLLMNFPALKAFKGTHDIAVDLKRRYSKKSLQKLVAGTAMVKEITYWPFFLSPAIFFIRTIQKFKFLFIKNQKIVSDVKMPPALVNRIFYHLTNFENIYMQTKPWGSSLFLVLQKPA